MGALGPYTSTSPTFWPKTGFTPRVELAAAVARRAG